MKDFLNVYGLDRRKTAVLQNAFDITETQELNGIYALSFSLPSTDEKNEFCAGRCFARWGEDGQLYRIIGVKSAENEAGTITYTCEHVIATLCDTLLFGSYTLGGDEYTTAEAITWLLEKQPEGAVNWTLGDCELSAEYEYGWEQENLLNALYSIPKPFVEKYRWDFDTTVYPWKVSLKKIDETIHPEYYIRAKHNLLKSNSSQDFSEVCTRLYPLGYGEGVNQLTIKDVNDGVPYLEASASAIEKYGIVDRVLVDKSFESADSLKAYGESMLEALSTPTLSRTFNVVDLYPITSDEINNASVGKVCRLTEDGTTCYVTGTTRVHDKAGNLKLSLSTKTESAADTIADLADRVRIESVYAQGATQIYQHSKDANATSSKGMVISLYFPSEMRQINKVLLRVKMGKFRTYSKATSSGGGSTATSGGGGGTVGTSSGYTSLNISLTSGTVWPSNTGGIVNCSVSGSSFNTGTSYLGTLYSTYAYITSTGTSHRHSVTPSGHYHSVPIPFIYKSSLSHSHSVSANNVCSHSHSITLSDHTHSVTIPAHTHDITSGIFEVGSSTSFGIYVGGTLKETVSGSSYNEDIVQWLLSDGAVPRDRWIDVELRPNNQAYFTTSVFVQGFVQSRGGGNY